jgi:hypothetical protein
MSASLESEILNIQYEIPESYRDPAMRMAYVFGHRDARHAAAEIAARPTEKYEYREAGAVNGHILYMRYPV